MSNCGRRALALGWVWSALLPLAAAAMPLHPHAKAELEATGGAARFAQEQQALAKAGLDRPVKSVGRAQLPSGMFVAVLLIDFSDWTWNRDFPSQAFTPDHYRSLLFSTGTHPTGSMRDYYLENSFGGFDLNGDVHGWIRMPQTYSYYVAGQRGTQGAYPRNARKMVEDAVRTANAQDPSLDWGQFDSDGPDGVPNSGDDDGVVDGLIVVHAGSGYEETLNPNDVHSHFWTVVDPDVIVDGVRVFQYMTCPQDGRVGVFSHEFGHNLGLPDLYETDAGGSSVVGVWSIMSLGAWLSTDGLPFGPQAGVRPAHFDAWSKVTLGFVEPDTLTDNAVARVLRPVEDFPDILHLWTNGDDSREYFLVENRAPHGFDRELPFASFVTGGLLIWHVDEDIATNDDPGHPLVQLEQADHRRDIESGINQGDRGDPYSLGVQFDRASTPSSRSHAGAETQVAVRNISIPVGANFQADFVVEDRPAIRAATLTISDPTGNGDGGLDATERVALTVTITNHGLAASDLELSLSTSDPAISVLGGEVALGALAANATLAVDGRFELVAGNLADDPHPFELFLHSTAASGYAATERVVLTAGDVIGYANSFDESALDFTHSAGRSGYRDDWRLAPGAGLEGSQGWYCAPPGSATYARLTDARLDSPVFALDGQAKLVFWHMMDAEVDVGDRAWDGGLVELSVAGGPFQAIVPTGGYPYVIVRNSVSPIAEQEVFSGQTAGFEHVECDLAGIQGAAQVRFHFGADGTIEQGGWIVDEVAVVSPAQPYAVRFPTPAVDEAGGVTVRFSVQEFFPEDPYQGQGFHVYRRSESPDFPLRSAAAGGTIPEGYERLTQTPLAPGASFVDPQVDPAEIYGYLLEDLREPGEASRLYGPRRVYVAGNVPAPQVVRTHPNPFPGSGAVAIEFVVPSGAGAGGAEDLQVKLSVYDVAGRLTRVLVDRPLRPGKNVVHWDGWSDRGFLVPSGVYQIRLEARGKSDTRPLVVVH